MLYCTIMIFYRVRQFLQALTAQLDVTQSQSIADLLGPDLTPIFERLSRDEQYHAWCVWQDVLQSNADQDLQQAALLHDCGKAEMPLTLLDRTWIVIGKTFFKSQLKRWAQEDVRTTRWQRPFVCAALHPKWGADLAANANANAKVVWLIAHHQDAPHNIPAAYKADYSILVAADNRH